MKHLLFFCFTSTILFSACGDDETTPEPLEILTAALDPADQYLNYQGRIVARGGTGLGYTWSLTQGVLPAGLTLAAQGTPRTEISGRAAEAGTFVFTVTVTDSGGNKAEKPYTLLVEPGPEGPSILTASLPDGVVGAPYNATLTASGGTSFRYQWQVFGSSLPAGLTLEFAGTPSTTLSGVPEVAGTFTFRIEVLDGSGRQALKEYAITIADSPIPLVISTPALSAATEGTLYSATLTASGGSGVSYTWSIVQGELPPGLSIYASGTPSTMISGTPTMAGSYVFSVGVQDSSGASARLELTIDVVPLMMPIELVTTEVSTGTVTIFYQTTLTAAGGTPPYDWTVSGGMLPGGLTLAAMGTPSTEITGMPANGGEYTATITVSGADSRTASRAFTFVIFGP